jgi:selT/selW/selH-like putative selenoprotein
MANRLPTIGIEYCHECGYVGFATKLTEALLRTFEGQLAGVLVIPSTGGAYEITLDGRTIYSTFEEGMPTQDEAVERVRTSLAQATVTA